MEDMIVGIDWFMFVRNLGVHGLWLIAVSLLSLLAIRLCLMTTCVLTENAVTLRRLESRSKAEGMSRISVQAKCNSVQLAGKAKPTPFPPSKHLPGSGW